MDYEAYLKRRGGEILAAQQVQRPLVFTRDAQPAHPQQDHLAQKLVQLNAKTDRLITLITKQVQVRDEHRRSQRLEPPLSSCPAPTFEQMHAQQLAAQGQRLDRICADARAAYASCNPHKNDRNFA